MKTKIESLWQKPIQKIDKLFGDASARIYFRILFTDNTTAILMQLPQGKMSASEEITNYRGEKNEIPFLNIQRYLELQQLPAVKVMRQLQEENWIFLEDLGDTRLADMVTDGNEAKLRNVYEKAIDLLVEMQQRTAGNVREVTDCIALQRSFDATLFNWEFDHFWEYFVQTRKNLPPAMDHKIFLKETRKITEKLLKLPQVFVHRDFQSRNLMWHKNRFHLIDFQDALLGPYVYDMVSLLRDSYIILDKPLRNHLMRYYCERTGNDLQLFTHHFHLQTVQRKMKDTGRFV